MISCDGEFSPIEPAARNPAAWYSKKNLTKMPIHLKIGMLTFCLGTCKVNWLGVMDMDLEMDYISDTVDGKNPAPVEVGRLSLSWKVLYIPGGAGFLPSTVSLDCIGDGFATGYETTCNSVENLTHLGLHRRVVWAYQPLTTGNLPVGWMPINHLPPCKLTYPLKVDGWKMTFPFAIVPLLGTSIFQGVMQNISFQQLPKEETITVYILEWLQSFRRCKSSLYIEATVDDLMCANTHIYKYTCILIFIHWKYTHVHIFISI